MNTKERQRMRMMPDPATVSREFHNTLNIMAGILTFQDVRVAETPDAYEALQAVAEEYRQRYGQLQISEVPDVHISRRLFREFGIEPTKYRPSSEALLRRALKQKDLYSVNNVVDVSNLCALDFLLPNGVYDLQRIHGSVVLGPGAAGAGYDALNHRFVHLEGRLCLSDGEGAFGSPMTDSLRCSVKDATGRILAVLYAPAKYPSDRMEGHLNRFSERMAAYAEASCTFARIVPPGQSCGIPD